MNDNHNQAIDGEAKAKPEVIKLTRENDSDEILTDHRLQS
jgi:hypothetical protein